MELLFNIMFYLIGITFALIPFILDYREKGFNGKPKWYKSVMAIIIALLVITGVTKTVWDSSEQKTNTENVVTLSGKIDKLKNADSVFMSHLNGIGITKDTSSNKPIIDKGIYNTTVNEPNGDVIIGGKNH